MFDDLPEALANTLVVAQRCAVMAPKRKPILPSVGDKEGEADQLRMDARAGLNRGGSRICLKRSIAAYFERLDFEARCDHEHGLFRLLPDRC